MSSVCIWQVPQLLQAALLHCCTAVGAGPTPILAIASLVAVEVWNLWPSLNRWFDQFIAKFTEEDTMPTKAFWWFPIRKVSHLDCSIVTYVWPALVMLSITVKALNSACDLFHEFRAWTVSVKLNNHTNILAVYCNNVTNAKSTKLNSNKITLIGKMQNIIPTKCKAFTVFPTGGTFHCAAWPSLGHGLFPLLTHMLTHVLVHKH